MSVQEIPDSCESLARLTACEPIQTVRANAVRRQQEIACERLLRAVARRSRAGRLDCTWKQLAEYCGLDVEGMNQKQARLRYRGALRNQIGYLIDWGLFSGFETLYEDNGEGRCIVIRLPAGVAQSVRAAESTRRGTPKRSTSAPRVRARRGGDPLPASSISEKVCTPLREPLRRGGDFNRLSLSNSSAATRERAVARDRARRRPAVAAAFATAEMALAWEGLEPTGQLVLEVKPGLADEPIEVVARQAWLNAGGNDGRLTETQQHRLEVAAVQLARTGYGPVRGQAAAVAALIDLAYGDWADWWDTGAKYPKAPATLGGLVECLRKVAHRQVAGQRARRRRARADRGSGPVRPTATLEAVSSDG